MSVRKAVAPPNQQEKGLQLEGRMERRGTSGTAKASLIRL